VRLALSIEADAKNRAAQELARDRWIEQRNASRIAAAKRAKASKILRRLSLPAALSDHDYIGAMFHLYAQQRCRVL
jgi:hypothetical protein